MQRLLLFSLLAFVIAAEASGSASVHPTLEIAQPAPDFHLPGVDGKTYSLGDFASAKILLVVFTCNHCPTAQAYEDRLMQMQRDYQDRGVTIVAICANDPQALRLDELDFSDL